MKAQKPVKLSFTADLKQQPGMAVVTNVKAGFGTNTRWGDIVRMNSCK